MKIVVAIVITDIIFEIIFLRKRNISPKTSENMKK
jgi:hypothetical protein